MQNSTPIIVFLKQLLSYSTKGKPVNRKKKKHIQKGLAHQLMKTEFQLKHFELRRTSNTAEEDYSMNFQGRRGKINTQA